MAALAREAFTGQRRDARWNEVQVVGGQTIEVPLYQGEMRQAAYVKHPVMWSRRCTASIFAGHGPIRLHITIEPLQCT